MKGVCSEDANLLSAHALSALDVYLKSLALSCDDDAALKSAQICAEAVSHLERCVLHERKVAMFVEAGDARALPPGWKSADLRGLAEFLLEHCVRSQATEYRRRCLELLVAVDAALVKEGKAFVASVLKQKGAEHFARRFEAGVTPLLSMESAETTARNALSRAWMNSLLAALDCYVVFIEKALLRVEEVFSDELRSKSVLFDACRFFVENLALKDCEGDGSVFTPKEIALYNRCAQLRGALKEERVAG